MKFLAGREEDDAMFWLKVAGRVARKALCLRAKCGAVIVKDAILIGEGYNAPPQDNPAYRTCLNTYELPKNYKYDHTCCMHAECRAILDATARNKPKLEGSRLYFVRITDTGGLKRSGKPYCTMCSRFALDTGIAEFVLWQREGFAVYPTDEYNELSYRNIKVKSA
jgi:deoxycytidylate deaminase